MLVSSRAAENAHPTDERHARPESGAAISMHSGLARFVVMAVAISVLIVLAANPTISLASVTASKQLLFVVESQGHKPDVFTKAFHAHSNWRIHYAFACAKSPGSVRNLGSLINIVVILGKSRRKDGTDALAVFLSNTYVSRSGSYRYHRGGYYRLIIEMSKYCAYSVTVRG